MLGYQLIWACLKVFNVLLNISANLIVLLATNKTEVAYSQLGLTHFTMFKSIL